MTTSLLEKTQTARFVYFNNEGMITSITSRQSEDTSEMFAYFELDDIISFIDGSSKFTDYTMKRSSNPLIFEIVKRNVKLRQRNVGSQITRIPSYGDGDIIVELVDDAIVISASDELVLKSNIGKNQSVLIAGTDTHPFFITHKDKPEFLISTHLVKFSDLLSGEKVTINYDYKYSISVYTRQYFDSYTLRRNQQ